MSPHEKDLNPSSFSKNNVSSSEKKSLMGKTVY